MVGILHFLYSLETMCCEGYEITVGQPQVITKIIDGKNASRMKTLW